MSGAFLERLHVGTAGDDVDQFATAINEMLEEIERLIKRLRGMADDVAHDIRTPLTRMKARLDNCRLRWAADEELCDALAGCATEIEHGLHTIASLLRLAELDGAPRRGAFIDVDLAELAQHVLELYEPLALSQDLTITRIVAPGPVHGDVAPLKKVLGNLVDNAIILSRPAVSSRS